MKRVEKKLIFVDDSGDPGLTGSPSEYLVMAAVAFNDAKNAELVSREISECRKTLGWAENCEFKFRKTNKKIVARILDLASRYDFAIYATYIKKETYKNIPPIVNTNKMSQWLIGELLQSIPMDVAKIEIDGKPTDRQTERIQITRLRKIVDPKHSKHLNIKYEDSAKDNLIQLADLVAGSINRYLNTDKTDYKKYIGIVEPKIALLKEIK